MQVRTQTLVEIQLQDIRHDLGMRKVHLINPQKARNERRHTPIPGLVNYLAWYNNPSTYSNDNSQDHTRSKQRRTQSGPRKDDHNNNPNS
jgi:hypothetical protein